MTNSNRKLALKAGLGVLSTPIIFGVPLFAAAGTFNYPAAWVFLAVFVIAASFLTLDLFRNDPEALKRRMHAGPTAEGRPAQRIIMYVILAAFFLLLLIAGLDHRDGWSHVPFWLIAIGNCVVALSFVEFYFVLKQNRFAAATIEVFENQKLASTGLYCIVRHPMYAGALLLIPGMALALGSYWALLTIALAFPALHWRILDEESCLLTELDGYAEYCTKVRYRLIPGIY